MSPCNIDHSLEDVQNKLVEQLPFLPETLAQRCKLFLTTQINQHQLNELFHLLKKYDLSTDEEQIVRNRKIEELVEQLLY
ncbi:hypothetical protein ACFSCX_11020 [Bacillus salitolerans]|uniref:Group-specific protein n=1 Tax=Bacillus salitolerans TaxID=1437434 RepID=A0ABW4LSL1_9BACI